MRDARREPPDTWTSVVSRGTNCFMSSCNMYASRHQVGSQLMALKGHIDLADCFAFSCDSSLLASASNGIVVRNW